MKTSDIRLIQKNLSEEGLYTGQTDGKRGPQTDKAVNAALSDRSQDLPDEWSEWPEKRKAVAYLQLICKDNDIDPGPIDGFYGPRTEDAANDLRVLQSTGTLPRPFADIEPVIANPHNFPIERKANLDTFYGKPCDIPLVKVPCPWTLRLDWDLGSTTDKITIHKKLADSLGHILEEAFSYYGPDGIRKHGLDRYGGSYNCRKKRGSMTSWSTHAWAIAIDWYPSKNKLKWRSDQASLAHPDLDFWWELWEKEGWFSLGRSENRDWMHVQGTRR
ncbi:hypothetical protein DENIS_1371 [Desulfonema ishimotonii]|uniref:Peptidase M15C domain-containing protein n=1 Tax=Desulfonema ishimotonii TaxID=45657 RepID=A0A401FTX3_9BACT|nr:peptidoglycan-binding protein [Desulfonema ishimotonii]GBC60419.1 hypothetical protein DENIS_1371 [Desulfonema ishimotonii]